VGLILVDSSVWIDQINDRDTIQTRVLRQWIIDEQDIGIGDLMLVEVLQGATSDRKFAAAEAFLAKFTPVRIADHRTAVASASHYRALRAKGITVRKTIDCLIATRCIVDSLPLLYSDRDFDPFVTHLGLMPAMPPPGVN
jgi:predicted nucleic acid-binding protein